MAVWPHARLTTYVSTTPPAIKASDLNDIQDAIIGLHGFPPFFGEGFDGAYAQAAGTVSAASNKYFTTFDLSGTAVYQPDCHLILATQRIRLRDTSAINARGVDGPTDSSAAGAGFGSGNQTLGNGGNGGAGNGAVGVAGTSKLNTSMGGSGGAGGNGGGGGVAGVGGAGGVASLNAQLEARTIIALLTGQFLGYDGTSYGSFPVQGGGGGGGGGQSAVPNDGLGGGGGGGTIILIAPVIDIGAGTIINARGGNGGSQSGGGAPGDFGGGGGGGGGGVIILVCSELIEDGTVSVTGGAGGIANAQGTGANGVAGTIIRRILF